MRNFDEDVAAGTEHFNFIGRDLIELQLIQYQAMIAIKESGLAEGFAFQGGSSIFGCYDGIRLSSDLDFVGKNEINVGAATAFSALFKKRMKEIYGFDSTVKNPNSFDPNSHIARWELKVNTTPQRPDIPHRTVKAEFALFPHHTQIVRNYKSRMFKTQSHLLLIGVEDKEELVADKALSFIEMKHQIRGRDLFDIFFFHQNYDLNLKAVAELFQLKVKDYDINNPKELLERSKSAFIKDGGSVLLSKQLDGMVIDSSYVGPDVLRVAAVDAFEVIEFLLSKSNVVTIENTAELTPIRLSKIVKQNHSSEDHRIIPPECGLER